MSKSLILSAILLISPGALAEGEAKPCMEKHMELVPTGTQQLLDGVTDEGSPCQVDSSYNKYTGSVSLMIAVNGAFQMSASFGTHYQFRKVKCSISENGLVLDSKRKDDEQYSSSVRHVLKVEKLENGLTRIELSKPGVFSSKKAHCNIWN